MNRRAVRHARRGAPKTTAAATRLHGWWMHHLHCAVASLGRLWRNPVGTAMTVAVIGIALALPAALYSAVHNLERLSGTFQRTAQLTAYLEKGLPADDAERLGERLRARADVTAVRFISPEQALAEFEQTMGIHGTLEALGENPLPAALVVEPARADPAAVEALARDLRALPGVEDVQVDHEWLQRLAAILELARRGIGLLALLLGAAVLLIIGNTIRLEIQNRRDEIEVTKLVGGTTAFVRRPFLYTGMWFGLAGGLLAWVLVLIARAWLHGPVQRLAGLYDSTFALRGLGLAEVGGLLAAGAVLGIAGAWLAAGRHLRRLEPA